MAFRFTHKGTLFMSDGVHARKIETPGQNAFLDRTGKYPMLSSEGNGEVQDDVFGLFKMVS